MDEFARPPKKAQGIRHKRKNMTYTPTSTTKKHDMSPQICWTPKDLRVENNFSSCVGELTGKKRNVSLGILKKLPTADECCELSSLGFSPGRDSMVPFILSPIEKSPRELVCTRSPINL